VAVQLGAEPDDQAWTDHATQVRRRTRLDQFGTVHCVGTYVRNVGIGADTTEKLTNYSSAAVGRKRGLLASTPKDHPR
jgi:hypothetical protein